MTVYTPILKGRRPALQALGHVADRVKGNIRPIIEVVPGRRDEDIKVVVTRLAKAVGRYIPEGINLTFDTGPLAFKFGCMAPREALLLLGAQLEPLHHAFRPVVHPEEDPDDLDDIRQLVGRHQMGVCLRLDRSYASNLGDSRSLVEQIDAIGVPAERADVVLDCGFICSAADPAIGVSGPLSHLLDGAWQSVTVAVGSFPGPAFFDGRLTRRVISIPRLEVALWEKIRRRWPGAVDYGDYGVDHPGPPPEEARPVPNLRYTTPEHWRLYQWPKDAFGGHSTFHQLCRSLVRSSDWPQDGPAFSWGDQQIALAACERIGPGSGAEWKAYAVSHHLAAIVDSLQPDGSAE